MTTLYLDNIYETNTSIYRLGDVLVRGVALWTFLAIFYGIFEGVPILNGDRSIQEDTVRLGTLDLLQFASLLEFFVFPSLRTVYYGNLQY